MLSCDPLFLISPALPHSILHDCHKNFTGLLNKCFLEAYGFKQNLRIKVSILLSLETLDIRPFAFSKSDEALSPFA